MAKSLPSDGICFPEMLISFTGYSNRLVISSFASRDSVSPPVIYVSMKCRTAETVAAVLPPQMTSFSPTMRMLQSSARISQIRFFVSSLDV